MKGFLTGGLDLQKRELKQAVIERLASNPSSPARGQVWTSTADDRLLMFTINGNENLLMERDLVDDALFTNTASNTIPSTASVKAYVQTQILATDWLKAVRVASTGNVSLAALNNGVTIDSVTLVTGDRVLLKDQTVQTENGIYIVAASGSGTRSPETAAQLANRAVLVDEGIVNGDKAAFKNVNETITFGTTLIQYAQIGSPPVPQATTTVAGRTRYATTAETIAKTDTASAVTPSGLASFPRKYAQNFTNLSSLTITSATHGLTSNSDIAVSAYALNGAVYQNDLFEVTIAANGDVTITSPVATDGKIVLTA
jgi:hypothetical protein